MVDKNRSTLGSFVGVTVSCGEHTGTPESFAELRILNLKQPPWAALKPLRVLSNPCENINSEFLIGFLVPYY